MKQLLLAACLAFAGISANAQTPVITYSATTSLPLFFNPIGNMDAVPTCSPFLAAQPYAMSPTPTTLVGTAAIPMSLNNITTMDVHVNLGGGVAPNYMLSLCGATVSANNPITFTGGAYSCFYDITSVSSSLITIVFHN